MNLGNQRKILSVMVCGAVLWSNLARAQTPNQPTVKDNAIINKGISPLETQILGQNT